MFRASRRADALAFTLVLLGVGYFHQGGGWNQNSRFAMVRAIVEDGSFAIDSHLLYRIDPSSSASLVRVPVRSGNFERDGTEYALAWRATSGTLLPVDPLAAGTRELVAVDDVAASGDVAYFGGHFHPNKAPGTSFLAVPGYALVRSLESLLGFDADSWAMLTLNAWLVSVLSVGVLTALGAVLVLRLARGLGSELGARLAALSFAFATMAWPYGTFLFEHNIIAVALVGALYCIERAAALARTGVANVPASRFLHAAGACAGYAAITNYTMAALVPVFALFLFVRLRSVPALAWFALGVLWPLLAICAYNLACFGTPFTTNYAYQSEMFRTESRVLGVFALPRMDVLLLLLFSPFRGLFFTSPVLLAAVAALVVLWRRPPARATCALIAAVAAFLLLVNASFNGWDGGWTAVPRYLGPAMALLAVPLVVAFDRWRALTLGLAAVSLAMQFLLTAVDPQVPIGDVGTAGVPVSEVFLIDPTTRYALPLFLSGRAWPLLDESIEEAVARAARTAASRKVGAAGIEARSAQLRADLRARVERGDGAPFPLAGVSGPVSANPIGVYEGYYYRLFAAGSPEAAGNSFNAGEIIFPQSRLSLLPLLLLGGALVALLFQRDDAVAVGHSQAGAKRADVVAVATSPAQPAATRQPKPAPPPPTPGKRRRR
ncbi:MAG: hypothetical protein ABR587_07065 [Candidatus Binatia bacterium]